MPFCSKDLSILNNFPSLKTMPAGEIEITRDDFGAKIFFYQVFLYFYASCVYFMILH